MVSERIGDYGDAVCHQVGSAWSYGRLGRKTAGQRRRASAPNRTATQTDLSGCLVTDATAVMARAFTGLPPRLLRFYAFVRPTDLKVAGHATGLLLNFKMQACPACRDPVLKSTGKVPLTDTIADQKARCPWQNSLVGRASPFWFTQLLMKR